MISLSRMLMVGRKRRYSGLEKGMMVLSPSLPPRNSMITRLRFQWIEGAVGAGSVVGASAADK